MQKYLLLISNYNFNISYFPYLDDEYCIIDRKLCYTYVILLPFKTGASFFMHIWLVILSFIDDKFTEWSKSTNVNEIIYTFNDGSTDSTEILEKLFKKPIAEIRSDEGNCLSYPERQMETKKSREKGKKGQNVLKTSHYSRNYC